MQSRSRDVVSRERHGGRGCPVLAEDQDCNAHPCPVHCDYTLHAWGLCTKTCAGGTQTRKVTVHRNAANGGAECPTESQRICNTQACPTPAPTPAPTMAPTAAPTKAPTPQPTEPAAPPAGMVLTRTVTTPMQFSGITASTWTAAAQEGTRIAFARTAGVNRAQVKLENIRDARRRLGAAMRAAGGEVQFDVSIDCEDDVFATDVAERLAAVMESPLHFNALVVSEIVRSMESAGEDATAAGAIVPLVTAAPSIGMTMAPTPSPTPPPTPAPTPAAVDCIVSLYSAWHPCNEQCGGGTQARDRTITTAPQHGGRGCPRLKSERNCNTQPCPVNCDATTHSWGACSASCGGGEQVRRVTVHRDAAHGGAACPTESKRVCNQQTCPTPAPTPAPTPQPVPCTVGDFDEWTACTEQCGGGVQSRSREVIFAARFGGTACPKLFEERNCNAAPCPVACGFSIQPWSECSKSCAGGSQVRRVTVHRAAAHGGAECPAEQERVCSTEACPTASPTPAPTPSAQDCATSTWGKWQPCSEPCGGGVQGRARFVKVRSAHGGALCPQLEDQRNCNTGPCPVDCAFTSLPWGPCSKTCGGGTQMQRHTVHRTAAHGGRACPTETQRVCESQVCPCPAGTWTKTSRRLLADAVTLNTFTPIAQQTGVLMRQLGAARYLKEAVPLAEGVCVRCPAGTYTDREGQATCARCGAGMKPTPSAMGCTQLTLEDICTANPAAQKGCEKFWGNNDWNTHWSTYCQWFPSDKGCSREPCPADCAKSPTSDKRCVACWTPAQFHSLEAQYCKWFPESPGCNNRLDCATTCKNPLAEKRCFHCWSPSQWNEHGHKFCTWYPNDPNCKHKCGGRCAQNPLDHKECHMCWDDAQWKTHYPDFCAWYPDNADCLKDNFCPVECKKNPLYNTMCTDCWSDKQWEDFLPVYCIWNPGKANCKHAPKVAVAHPQRAPTDADCESHRWDLRTADYCCDKRLPEWELFKFPKAKHLRHICDVVIGQHKKPAELKVAL